MQPKSVALRKRTQIAKANRTMFIWVACVSVIFGFALVGSIFLGQMLMFNEKVLAEKDKTIAVLKTNNSNVTELESQVRMLDANQSLIDVKAKPDDRALQVILDALPSDANSLALGASLQTKLLTGITLNSLQVDPVDGVESLSNGATAATGSGEITFRFSVSGTEQALRQTLNNLERSIRTIDVVSFKIETQGDARVLTVQAKAFYEPSKTVELKDKVIR
ncbi:MAG: hypothetical protein WCI79_01510 [Candidatus Saccharibacteria bacterium]